MQVERVLIERIYDANRLVQFAHFIIRDDAGQPKSFVDQV